MWGLVNYFNATADVAFFLYQETFRYEYIQGRCFRYENQGRCFRYENYSYILCYMGSCYLVLLIP